MDTSKEKLYFDIWSLVAHGFHRNANEATNNAASKTVNHKNIPGALTVCDQSIIPIPGGLLLLQTYNTIKFRKISPPNLIRKKPYKNKPF